MEENDLQRAADELLAHSAEDVVFQPHAAHGEEIRGRDELREFWTRFADEGLEMRAGAYSISEEGDSVW
jgi:ketosteroid isomerase-like protein